MENIYIALENIRSLYNVGGIMRACSFFGFNNIILIGYSGPKFNFKGQKVLHPELEKTALGAEDDVNVTFLENNEELFHFAKDNDLKIVSIEQDSKATMLKDWKPGDNSILVFGNEVKGVTKETLDISDEIVEIDRLGNKSSLNVTTANGIVLYHLGKMITARKN